MNPLLSFVVPCYNSESTIVRTLKSIFSQEVEFEFEVIVVDNGSKDKTVKMISGFEIKLFKEERRGANHARNLGIKNAKGQYIAFVDSDVVLNKKWAQELIDYMIDKKLVGAQDKVIRTALYDENSFLERYRCSEVNHPTSWINLVTRDYQVGQINTAACIYKASALEQVGGFSTVLRIHEDSDLTFKIRSLPEMAIGCTRSAVASCYFSGGMPAYLKRAVVSGYYMATLLKKWNLVKGKTSKNEFSSFKFFMFYKLLGLLSKFGELLGRLSLVLSFPAQLKQEISWLRKICILPKSQSYSAYFEGRKLKMIME